jgi:2-C-methyl-D-erythritol 4-phosphate cytidylyltransferase
MNDISDVCVILLAGGVGSRMNSSIPKQFLSIKNKQVAKHSFDLFLSLPEVKEIVVVCALEYRSIFEGKHSQILSFALPGERRQDSLYNGLQAVKSDSPILCIHDSARPFITIPLVRRVLEAGRQHGAATAGMPVKFTLKECDGDQLVKQTPNRSHFWEIQTPQVVQSHLLKQGFEHVNRHNLTVTDDVSLIEHLGLPVKVVEGCYKNFKITTPDDLALSEFLLKG